jgi:hypothetical protein
VLPNVRAAFAKVEGFSVRGWRVPLDRQAVQLLGHILNGIVKQASHRNLQPAFQQVEAFDGHGLRVRLSPKSAMQI